jgi:hypothetical protein
VKTKKTSLARIIPAFFMLVKSSKKFALGIVFCGQSKMTFEVTDASSRAATRHAYERVQ